MQFLLHNSGEMCEKVTDVALMFVNYDNVASGFLRCLKITIKTRQGNAVAWNCDIYVFTFTSNET